MTNRHTSDDGVTTIDPIGILTNQVESLSKRVDDLFSVLANLKQVSDAPVQATALQSFEDGSAEKPLPSMPMVSSHSEAGELSEDDRLALGNFLRECGESGRVDHATTVAMHLLHSHETAANTKLIGDVMSLVKKLMGDLGYKLTADLQLVGGPDKEG